MNRRALADQAKLTRRSSLLALAVPFLNSSAHGATADPVDDPAKDSAAQAAQRWMQLLTGKGVAYWLTQGSEFVIVDGAATPVKGRIGVIVARSRPRDDGGHRVTYLLHGCNVSPEGHELDLQLRHPVTGEPIPVVAGAPLRLGLNVTANGAITEDLMAANGTHARYRGRAWTTPGFGTESVVTAKLDIRLERPGGAVETLAETSQLHASPAAGASQDELGVRSETMTTREVIDKRRYEASLVYTVSVSRGLRFDTVDAMQRMLAMPQARVLKDFFDQQGGWLRGD